MKNIRDIREEKNLFFLLPEEVNNGDFPEQENVAVIVYLYYEDSVCKYLSYVDNIPLDFQIYFVSGNAKTIKIMNQYALQNSQRKIKIIKKENRGRDISALLVSCREICMKHEYICFVHDKKRKEWQSEEEFDLWTDNLWGNSLGSTEYILNLLYTLRKNKEIGMLVPPEPMGTYLNSWFINAWGGNFETTRRLAQDLKLDCNLDIDKSPITLGTFFWVKSIAIKKLLEKEWQYSDFDEEPLKEDGTLSHAIERILGYVVQDAGYDVGTAMTISYAAKMLVYTQKKYSPVCQFCVDRYGFSDAEEFLSKREEIYSFCKKNEKIYLFGAGRIGRKCKILLQNGGFKPQGYVVSKKNQGNLEFEGLPVKMLDEVKKEEAAGFILAVGRTLQAEVEHELKVRGIENYIQYF